MKENKAELLARIFKLHKLFHEGMIPVLSHHEVHPGLDRGSRENYLYFTLPPCVNFQRNSPAMWASALKTHQDPETNYLFFPEKVVRIPREKIQADLLKYKLALQLNKHTDIWMTICKTIHDHFNDDPRILLKKGNWDVIQIHNIIQNQQRKLFPYLSGPKMSNYWLYILTSYTDVKFKNMGAISIIPDTHVLQCSLKLGITDKVANSLVVAELWKDLLAGSGLSPVEMHPVLWNWSRNNFMPKV